MTGPYHYKRAEVILAEIEAANAVSNDAGARQKLKGQHS
jgi:hypothetical protein